MRLPGAINSCCFCIGTIAVEHSFVHFPKNRYTFADYKYDNKVLMSFKLLCTFNPFLRLLLSIHLNSFLALILTRTLTKKRCHSTSKSDFSMRFLHFFALLLIHQICKHFSSWTSLNICLPNFFQVIQLFISDNWQAFSLHGITMFIMNYFSFYPHSSASSSLSWSSSP